MFLNVVLEKDGEDHLEQSCEKWRSITYSQSAEAILHEKIKQKCKLIGHILRRNCLLERVIEGNIEGGYKWQEDEEEDVIIY